MCAKERDGRHRHRHRGSDTHRPRPVLTRASRTDSVLSHHPSNPTYYNFRFVFKSYQRVAGRNTENARTQKAEENSAFDADGARRAPRAVARRRDEEGGFRKALLIRSARNGGDGLVDAKFAFMTTSNHTNTGYTLKSGHLYQIQSYVLAHAAGLAETGEVRPVAGAMVYAALGHRQ